MVDGYSPVLRHTVHQARNLVLTIVLCLTSSRLYHDVPYVLQYEITKQLLLRCIIPRRRPLLPTRLALLPQWVMERTQYAVDSEEHAQNEPFIDDLRGSHENEEITRAAGTHLASISQKKRLWLKNAVINALFIAIWSVDNLQ